mmetsp:Transcript_8055/g.21785  ORF Transcript_8055/g.21785 Transcript_8055/m.21785 type:complete len:261 (-) Transcript_8055:1228-2010(-)
MNQSNNAVAITDTKGKKPESICWSSISRNEVILVEAGDDHHGGMVIETARKLTKKKATPGWEFATASPSAIASRRQPDQIKLKGVKLHVYEYDEASGDQGQPLLNVWSYCAVYDPKYVELPQVQSFLEKMVSLTEYFRFEDDLWKFGDTLAAQESFAMVLQQRMEEVTYYGKMAMIQDNIDHAKDIMARNIELILTRDEKIESVQEKATRLKEMSSVFKKNAKEIKRKMLWQNAKHGLVMGSAITAGVAVVVVPPLVALL